jgi:hypothetical protein
MTPEALKSLRPDASWALDGENIIWESDPVTGKLFPKNLTWYSQDSTAPSKEEIDQEIKRLQKKWRDEDYRRKRTLEYPQISEFIDAYYWEKRGDSSKMEIYLEKIDNIKNKYPSSKS